MITQKDYEQIASLLKGMAQYFTSGVTIAELKSLYDWNETQIDHLALCEWSDVQESIELIKKALSSVVYDDKVITLINEWNEHVAPIFGVKCNTFDEFAIQAATVSSQWAKYKSAEAIPQQQPVQPQQNQMFVDVNTLVSENTYLKSLNASKDEEIKSLRERLVALGQPV